jgi:phytoene synthase
MTAPDPAGLDEWRYPNPATAPGSSLYYSIRFAPQPLRDTLAALAGWRRQVHAVLEEVSDPGVARLKLDWWRDEARRTLAGEPRHPLSYLLASSAAAHGLSEAAFIGIVDRVEAELRRQRPADADALQAQDRSDQGALFELMARCHGQSDETTLTAARDIGAWCAAVRRLRDAGLLLRRGRTLLPTDRLDALGLGAEALADPTQRQRLPELLAPVATELAETEPKTARPLPRALRIQRSIHRALLVELTAAGYPARQPPRLLRRRRPRHRHRRARARAVRRAGAPVYVRHEVVHNRYVVEDLKARGAIFVDDVDLPERRHLHLQRPRRLAGGPRTGRRARGCASSTPPARWSPRCTWRSRALQGRLRRGADRPSRPPGGGGHHGPVRRRRRAHAPGRDIDEVAALGIRDPTSVAYVTQTTLSVDDTSRHRRRAAGALPEHHRGRRRATSATPPRTARTRCATSPPRRPGAGGRLHHQLQLQPAARAGREAGQAGLSDRRRRRHPPRMARDGPRVGLTAGASAPELLVEQVIAAAARTGAPARSRSSPASARTSPSRCPRNCSDRRDSA